MEIKKVVNLIAFFLISILFATLIMTVIYGVILIVATQSAGIWSNLIGFVLLLVLILSLLIFNPYEIKKKEVGENNGN